MRQFILEIEGSPDDVTDDYNLLVDTMPIDDSPREPQLQASEHFYSGYGISDSSRVFLHLADQTVFHAFSRTHRLAKKRDRNTILPRDRAVIEIATFLTWYSEDRFAGILIDTGAVEKSTAGIRQFRALQKEQKTRLDETRAGEARITFGIGEAASLKVASVWTLLSIVKFHIIPANIPFLLSLADLNRARATYNNLLNVII